VLNGGCPEGEWIHVTPAEVDLTSDGTCGNFGTKTVQFDSRHPQDAYTHFFCQGIYKSSDYGQTWTGPINSNNVQDCAGGITLGPTDANTPPILYLSCIRGAAIGFCR